MSIGSLGYGFKTAYRDSFSVAIIKGVHTTWYCWRTALNLKACTLGGSPFKPPALMSACVLKRPYQVQQESSHSSLKLRLWRYLNSDSNHRVRESQVAIVLQCVFFRWYYGPLNFTKVQTCSFLAMD